MSFMMGGSFPKGQCAVVAGLDLNGLGVVRSLGAAGVAIAALDTALDKPTATSRFGRKVKIRSLSGSTFIDDLLSLRQQFDVSPVLFLTQEASVQTVSQERQRLEGAYRFTMPNHGCMLDMLDKLKFQSIAEKCQAPIPRAVRVSKADSVEGTRHLRFPCALKPTTKHSGYGKRFAKAYKVTSSAEVESLWLQMQEVVDEIVVQEWIEGGDADVYFCLQYRVAKGEAVSFAGRKICQWPPLLGGTASCMPAPEDAEKLTALTNAFFAAVGFVGLGSMEYKRDTRDGRFYMVEPTVGRTDYQEEIATLNGANIPFAAFLGELGLPPPRFAPVDPPRAWRDPVGYARARMAGAPDPMLSLAPRIKVCDAYFRMDDPMPYVASKLQGVRRRLSRTLSD